MLLLTEGVLVDVAFDSEPAPDKTAVDLALDKLAPPGSVEEDWAFRTLQTVLLSGAGGVALFEKVDRSGRLVGFIKQRSELTFSIWVLGFALRIKGPRRADADGLFIDPTSSRPR